MKLYKSYFTYLLVFVSFLNGFNSYAQNLEVGGGLGATNTRTDVSNLNPANSRYAFQAFIRYNFTEAWVARLDYKYMVLAGDDKNNNTPLAAVRQFKFQTNVQQFSLNAEYNFLNFRGSDKKVRLSPYLTLGVGLCKFPAYFDQYGTNAGGYNFCIPFGLGLKYVLNKNFNLGMVFESTKTFTDDLDDINSNYPRFDKANDQHIRGWDPATNDWYYFLGLNVSYTIYTIVCPSFYDF